MNKTEDTGVPEFRSLEQERQYWETRGPLAEGRKGRVSRPRPGQKRSSFLAVRLTGDELIRLRDIAEKQGMGPSTFARNVLMEAIERQSSSPRTITVDEVAQALEASMPPETKDKVEALFRAMTMGNPPILLELTDKEKLEEFSHFAAATLLSFFGVRMTTPVKEQLKEPGHLAKPRV